MIIDLSTSLAAYSESSTQLICRQALATRKFGQIDWLELTLSTNGAHNPSGKLITPANKNCEM
jgi:hypothetical protein